MKVDKFTLVLVAIDIIILICAFSLFRYYGVM